MGVRVSAVDLIMISYHTGFSARGGRSFVTLQILLVRTQEIVKLG